jgi:hypothetical protein
MKNGLLNHLSLVLLLALPVISGCSSSGPSDPRATVIAMFGAMEKNDRAALAHLLDLGALMSNVSEDYALQTDSPRVITNPQQILDDLTGDGLTKTRWFALQRIVNKAEVTGETATVQVTFVDKASSTGYMTKFGLHVVNGKWKIYSFKTFQEPG